MKGSPIINSGTSPGQSGREWTRNAVMTVWVLSVSENSSLDSLPLLYYILYTLTPTGRSVSLLVLQTQTPLLS